MNCEFFPEAFVLDHFSDSRDRGLRAFLPFFVCWFLQVGTIIDSNVSVPNKPSAQCSLEINSKGSAISVVTAVTA